MTPNPDRSNRTVFIVRLWCQEIAGRPTWRGEMQHVESGRLLVFDDLRMLATYVQAHLAAFDRTSGGRSGLR